MLIQTPSSLSASSTSDISHLTSVYTQLTDGNHDISLSSSTFTNIDCQSISSSDQLFLAGTCGSANGDQSENIDNILKSSGHSPESFPNEVVNFYGSDYSANYAQFVAVVRSYNGVGYLIKVREWN